MLHITTWQPQLIFHDHSSTLSWFKLMSITILNSAAFFFFFFFFLSSMLSWALCRVAEYKLGLWVIVKPLNFLPLDAYITDPFYLVCTKVVSLKMSSPVKYSRIISLIAITNIFKSQHNYKWLSTTLKLLLYQMKTDIDSDEISYVQRRSFPMSRQISKCM